MDKIHKLLHDYLEKFNLCPVVGKAEFHYWFTPNEGILDWFVAEDKDVNITDMASYYCLPMAEMHYPVHKTFRNAFSFCNVSTKTTWLEVINDAIISAKNMDVMENNKFFKALSILTWRCIFEVLFV